MTAIALAFAFLRRRWGQALLSIFVGALGIAAVVTAILGAEALPNAAERAWGGVDLVIGPKSSALDLVLCCVLHVSDPTGLVSQKSAMAVERNPWVRVAAPIALGDNVRGWRIAGTTPALLSVYRADLKDGRVYLSVIGSTEQKQRALETLERQHGQIQHELARRIVLKYTPRLKFILDETEARASRIEHLLDELEGDKSDE